MPEASVELAFLRSSILKREKALAPLCAVAHQHRTAEPTENPRKMGLCWHLGSFVLAGARYATWCLCWRLLFWKMLKKPVFTACLAGTNPGTSGAFCGANPIFCLFSANIANLWGRKALWKTCVVTVNSEISRWILKNNCDMLWARR